MSAGVRRFHSRRPGIAAMPRSRQISAMMSLDRAGEDVVVHVQRIQAVQHLAVQDLGLGVVRFAIDGVFNRADDLLAGGDTVDRLGLVGDFPGSTACRGGCCG